MGKFEGKVIIITGSSSGIGLDAAVLFASEGASVTLHGQSEERLKNAEKLVGEAAGSSKKVLTVRGSLEDEKTAKNIVDETVKKFGKIDVLINNAGVSHRSGDTDLLSLSSYDYVFAANLRGTINLTQHAVPHLEKTKGNIINVSSIGAMRPFTSGMYYCMAKAALDHYTRGLACILADKGIRVNGVNPGGVMTNFNTRHGMTQEAREKFEDKFMKKLTPLKRSAQPREISNVLKFLASDEASYVTGALWVVDGGTLVFTPGAEQLEEELLPSMKQSPSEPKRSSSKNGKRSSSKNGKRSP